MGTGDVTGDMVCNEFVMDMTRATRAQLFTKPPGLYLVLEELWDGTTAPITKRYTHGYLKGSSTQLLARVRDDADVPMGVDRVWTRLSDRLQVVEDWSMSGWTQ